MIAALLLVSAALAQAGDGNLIEIGTASFSEAKLSLVPAPPRLKIFRDGRLLFIDRSGAWQAQIAPDRVANLERDLRRMPLLRETHFIDLASRPILPDGGLSYARFGEGGDEVLVAAAGIPIDPDWTAMTDRIEAERPPVLEPFRPARLPFRTVTLVTAADALPHDAWPFDGVKLAGHDENPIETDDPAVVAFVVEHAYGPKAFINVIRQGSAGYWFLVANAPGWFDIQELAPRLFALWRAAPHPKRPLAEQNFIEYGMGGFGEDGQGSPMLFPPEVKIYGDGRIVFAEKEGYRQGMVEPRELEKLKRELAAEPLLKRTQLLPVRNGGLISLHGGMAYIRYGDGDDEIVVAVLSHPRRGPYVNLLKRIRNMIPATYSSFRPKEITFRLLPGSAWHEPLVWPFSASISLAGHVRDDAITITDPAAIAFILDHAAGGFSWAQTNVRENGVDYEIILQSSPLWYEPELLGPKLERLHMEASSK